MQSAAGYYIGRTYIDEEYFGAELPYSRDTGYFPTKEDAEEYLQMLT